MKYNKTCIHHKVENDKDHPRNHQNNIYTGGLYNRCIYDNQLKGSFYNINMNNIPLERGKDL